MSKVHTPEIRCETDCGSPYCNAPLYTAPPASDKLLARRAAAIAPLPDPSPEWDREGIEERECKSAWRELLAVDAGSPECDELRQPHPVLTGAMGDPWWYGYSAPELVALYPDDDEPTEVKREVLADAETTLAYLLRDRLDDEADARRRSVEGRKPAGTEYPVGWQGEYEWLSEVLQQLRTEYRGLLAEATKQRRVNMARAKQFAQLVAIQRRAESLKARYNVRRYIEALGGDPEGYVRRDTWIAEEQSWKAAVKTLDADYYKDGVAAEGLLAH